MSGILRPSPIRQNIKKKTDWIGFFISTWFKCWTALGQPFGLRAVLKERPAIWTALASDRGLGGGSAGGRARAKRAQHRWGMKPPIPNANALKYGEDGGVDDEKSDGILPLCWHW